MKKDISLLSVFIILVIVAVIAINSIDRNKEIKTTQMPSNVVNETPSSNQIKLYNKSNDGKNYTFTYKDEDFTAIYTEDNWKIVDSYKITNKEDMKSICEALIKVHPIHGKDMVSYRTVEDLVYEWEQHNIAYNVLPTDSKWSSSAKDVDLNPEDQGKNITDFVKNRI